MFVREERDVPVNMIREDSGASAIYKNQFASFSEGIKFSFLQNFASGDNQQGHNPATTVEKDSIGPYYKHLALSFPFFYMLGHRSTR